MAIERDTEKRTIRLYVGDSDRLSAYYPQLGYNAVIRALVSEHLKTLDAKLEANGLDTTVEINNE